jgi:hypothetical protein
MFHNSIHFSIDLCLDEFKNHLLPILQKNSVNIIMGGHSHIYQRGYSKKDNITYLIGGGGGGELEKENERIANYHIYNCTFFGHHYIMMDIGEKSVYFTASNLSNTLFDQFEVLFSN